MSVMKFMKKAALMSGPATLPLAFMGVPGKKKAVSKVPRAMGQIARHGQAMR